MKRLPLISWLPALLYYVFIAYMSGRSPVFPTFYSDTPNMDKVFHVMEYTFFGLVLARDLFWQSLRTEESYSLKHVLVVAALLTGAWIAMDDSQDSTLLFLCLLVLIVTWQFSALLTKKVGWVKAFAVSVLLFIFLDEFHQSFIPERVMDFYDGVADVIGAGLGAWLFATVIRGNPNARTPQERDELMVRDRSRFAILLIFAFFFMIMTVNVLKIKIPVERKFPLLGSLFDFFEWCLLGYVLHRALYFLRGRTRLRLAGWVGLVAAGAFLLAFYRVALDKLGVMFVRWEHMVEITFYFSCGVAVSAFRRVFDRLKLRMRDDPTYKRETLQRLYYYYFPILIGLVIFTFSAHSSRDIAQKWFRYREMEISIYGTLFFALGLMTSRAVSWECWWQEKGKRRVIWLAVLCLPAVLVFLNEFAKVNLGGRPWNEKGLILNAAAMLGAFLIYQAGSKFLRSQNANDTHHHSS